MKNPTDILFSFFNSRNCLLNGNARQISCCYKIQESHLLDKLSAYTPVLVGTIPLGIDLPESDVDIICRYKDFAECKDKLNKEFSKYEGFQLEEKVIRGDQIIKCSFIYAGEQIEIFASSQPVTEQNGYLHMIAEHRILRIGGEPFREKVMELRKAGMKTEPAFAHLLGLEGDPYERILEINTMTEEQLKILVDTSL
jgi:hypothetical protein